MIGAGPAGRSRPYRGLAAGLPSPRRPHPDRPWQATYGAWADELPGLAANRMRGGHRARCRIYPVAGPRPGICDFRHPGTAVGTQRRWCASSGHGCHTRAAPTSPSPTVRFWYASTVVDARGVEAARPAVDAPEQTAVGIVVSHGGTAVEHRPADDRMVVMDWRPGTGTFVYSVDLGRAATRRGDLPGRRTRRRHRRNWRRLRDGYPGWPSRSGGKKGGRSRVSTGAEIVRFPLVD